MKILVTGGTGFIGKALCIRLLRDGHAVAVLSRAPKSVLPPLKPIATFDEIPDAGPFDAVINLAGEPIANKRWSRSQKQRLIDSRIKTTQDLISYFKSATTKPRIFISSSAVGFYGLNPAPDQTNENDLGDNSFCSQLCQQWEAVALEAEALGIRTCVLRIGLVLGPGGGALSKMKPAFRLGLGGVIGHGEQWMSWIHRADLLGIILHCLADTNLHGAVNATAPRPVTNREFTASLGAVLRRPTFFPAPAIVLKLVLGQMGEELLLSGQRVLPTKISAAGYVFQYQDLPTALLDAVG